MTTVGGIVLCGGKSSRMGLPKASLPFGPEVMLQRVVRILGAVVSPIVVVAAEDQTLPELAQSVIVTRDLRPERGPLEGIAAGLSAIAPHADAAYITSCDVPLLEPAFVRFMIDRLSYNAAAVPVQGPLLHPLSAVYSTSVLPILRELLAADRLRPVFIFDRVKTVRVPVEELQDVDPQLNTLRNLNFPADYFSALSLAGFDPEPTVLQTLQQANSQRP